MYRLAAGLVIIVIVGMSLQSQTTQSLFLESRQMINSQYLMAYVDELTDPKYKGRLSGMPEYLEAAEWVSEKFDEFGLIPGAQGYQWFQYFEQPSTRVMEGCSLTLLISMGKGDTLKIPYHYFDEYMPGSTSGNGTIEAEVVFCGYGITAPELGYDDYKGVDVEGKIVLMRPEAPVSPSVGVEGFKPWLEYSTHQYKMQNAVDHGVAGILYHYGPLANSNNDYHAKLINTLVGERVVNDLFTATGQKYTEVVDKMHRDLRPASFNLNKRVSITNRTEYHPDGESCNVVGLFPGTDPELSKEFIVVGAHLDHVGQCYEICQGANDNASGMAVMMGIAEFLGKSNLSPARSILFVAFGSEEQNLGGSSFFVKNIPELMNIIGFFNIDCVGVGPDLYVSGGLDHPRLMEPVSSANTQFVHRNLQAGKMVNAGRPRSDAAVFSAAGIPSLSFSSGGGAGYYHNPLDKPETLWPETMEDLTRMLSLALADLAGCK